MLGIWGTCAVYVFHFISLGGVAESCFFYFCPHSPKKITTKSLVDRGGGIEDVQHCIIITRGQEEWIPKTASVVGT